MKKILLAITFAFVAICFTNLNAQVTIGSNSTPNANAVLDLISGGNKGLLLPRVPLITTTNPSPTTVHTAGMTVYNTAVSPGGTDISIYVSPGLYYNDGTKWVRMPMGYTNWFYMPSVSFNTATNQTGATKDLYTLYKNQFLTPAIKSAGAPTSVPYMPAATDLYYYITEYDTSVFSNISITASGVMTYNVIAGATDCSYINIVFVLK